MTDYITKIDNFIAPVAQRSGFSLARVGGSVRDEILGRRVKDADYVAFGVTLSDLGDYLTGFAMGEGGTSITPLKLRDGRQAGWRVFKKGYGLIEIMLPRTEASTGPGHGDFEIVLDHTLTPAQDAQRRDFTFNALYRWIVGGPTTSVAFAGPNVPYSVLTNVEDPTGRGLYDLQHKLIHTTHVDSFRDDPLRILRALRFVSVLGYDLSSDANDEMVDHAQAAHGLSQVYKRDALEMGRFDGSVKTIPAVNTEAASGTVLAEMTKLLMGDDCAKALRLMRDTGVLGVVFPELAPMIGFEQASRYHDLTTDEHTFTALEAAAKADASEAVRWALLFHDSGKPASAWMGLDNRLHYYEPSGRVWSENVANSSMSLSEPKPRDHEVVGEEIWRKAAERMNTPRDLRERVATLIRNHMVNTQPRNAGVKVRRARVQFGDDLLRELYLHRACDIMGKGKPNQSHLRQIGELEILRCKASTSGVPTSVKDLEIDGRWVMGLGVHGKKVGDTLKAVLDEVVCDPSEQKLSREWQLNAAERLRP